MVGKRKSKIELSGFLLKRGLWLVFIEMTFVNFAWYFDIYFRSPGLLVIWSLGISMIVLSALIHLPGKLILLFSLLFIFCHNFLDNIHYGNSVLWGLLHEFSIFKITEGVEFTVLYPVIPWIAVMALGYYFGSFYDNSFDSTKRKRAFNLIGISALILFIINDL